MRKVDFSIYEKEVPSVNVFGLVDPDDRAGKQMVYISLDRTNDKWGAEVLYDEKRSDYRFIPVDNNILLKRDDGSDASRCDAVLKTERTVCFIELKDQRRGYISKAKEQIYSTMDFFEGIEKFEHKLAYISNRRKEISYYSTKNEMNAIMKERGILLRISSTIKELI